MKHRLLLALILTLPVLRMPAQNPHLVICPKVEEDAYLDDLNGCYPAHPDFPAIAWTNGGTPVVARGYIRFEISNIPAGFVLQSATLDLYNNPTSTNNGSHHSSMSGSNESLLRRVTGNWTGSALTWFTQPPVTPVNEVLLPQSISPTQDYLGIDVTTLVQDMLQNPTYGLSFQLALRTESYYRCLIFASSDHLNPGLHPRLCLTGTVATGLTETASPAAIQAYPQPASTHFSLRGLDRPNCTAVVHNLLGQEVLRAPCQEDAGIGIQHLESGMYMVTVLDPAGQKLACTKLVVDR